MKGRMDAIAARAQSLMELALGRQDAFQDDRPPNLERGGI